MKRSPISAINDEPRLATVGDLRAQLAGLADTDQILVEFPGAMRPVAGIAVRATPEDGMQLVVLADL